MRLFRIMSLSRRSEYDVYYAAIVAAKDEDAAKRLHPDGRKAWDDNYNQWFDLSSGKLEEHLWQTTWPNKLSKIEVTLIGTATPGTKPGVVLADFNAG